MNSEYKVNEEGVTSDGYRRLDPVTKKAMGLKEAIIFVALSLLVFSAVHYRTEIFGDFVDMAMAVMLAIYVLITAYLIAWPKLFYEHYCFKIDDDKVEVRKGIFVISHTLVPIERIHQVNVRRGPISRRYGLADIVITTAGGVVTLDYLDSDVADGIAIKLNDCVVKLLKERD